MRNYTQSRTAFLFSGEQLDLQEFQSDAPSVDEAAEAATVSCNVHFKPETKKLVVGSAAAVDRRGYFVTAAHCVDDEGKEGGVYLAFSSDLQSFVLEKARVVWSGQEASEDGLDFAVLKVASSVQNVFDWGQLPETGDIAVSIGGRNESDREVELMMALMAGEILSAYNPHEIEGESMLIWHDSPLREGNSGGPLVSRDGQLVGINYARCWSIQAPWNWRKRCAYAARPDVEWLADLIDRDYAALSE